MNQNVLTSSIQNAAQLKTAIINLTNAELITMYSAPTLAIAAPVAGSLVEVISATFEFAIGATSFLLGGAIGLFYTNAASPPLYMVSQTIAATALTANTGTITTRPNGNSAAVIPQANSVGQAVYIGNLTQNFSQVGGLGTGRVMLTYRITSGW